MNSHINQHNLRRFTKRSDARPIVLDAVYLPLYQELYDWVRSAEFRRTMDKEELAITLKAPSVKALSRLLLRCFGPRVMGRRRGQTVHYQFPPQEQSTQIMAVGRSSVELRQEAGILAPDAPNPRRHECPTHFGDWSILTKVRIRNLS